MVREKGANSSKISSSSIDILQTIVTKTINRKQSLYLSIYLCRSLALAKAYLYKRSSSFQKDLVSFVSLKTVNSVVNWTITISNFPTTTDVAVVADMAMPN